MQIGAAYIRVSTDDQLEFSPSAQKRAICEYAKKHDIFLDEEFIFIDEGISGRKAEKRPAFMKMITTAKKKPRPFDIILVHKFDRFARNREDSVVYKSLLRKECNIKVVSITEQMEDDKFSIILESMLEAMAEYYSLNLAEEVKKGMFEKARRGEHIGKAPYGYDLAKKALVPNPYELSIVKNIFEMYVTKGESLRYISWYLNENKIYTKQGNKWRTSTLRYLLQNHVYLGLTRYNYKQPDGYHINNSDEWVIAPSSHEVAISPDRFQKAQKRINETSPSNFRNLKAQKINSWCQHLAVCSECGRKLILHTTYKGKYFSFVCGATGEGLCTKRNTWSNRKLEALALETIKRDIKTPATLRIQAIPTTVPDNELDYLSRRLKKIRDEKLLIKKAYLAQADTIEEYKENKAELEKDEAKTLAHRNRLKENIEKPKKGISQFKGYLDMLSTDTLTMEEKNKIAKQFIKSIRIDLSTKEILICYYVS